MSVSIYSDLKMVWHTEKLTAMEEGAVTPPLYVRIKPTNRCCHNCWFCVYNHAVSGMHGTFSREDQMPQGKLMEVIDDCAAMGVKAVTFTGGGEPLSYADIANYFRRVKQFGIGLSCITNGQLLYGEAADELLDAAWVRISVSYHDRRSFEETRKAVGFDQVIANIRDFCAKDHRADLGINFVVTKENVNDIRYAYDLYRDLGADNIRFCPVWVDDFDNYYRSIKVMAMAEMKLLPNDPKFPYFHTFNDSGFSRERQYMRCYWQQINPVIAADCGVYTCHNKAYDAGGRIGSIQRQSFKQMWESDQTRNFFDRFYPDQRCHHQCANDRKNLWIRSALSSKGDNFV